MDDSKPLNDPDWEAKFLQCVWNASLHLHEVIDEKMALFLEKAKLPGSTVLSWHD